MRFLVLFAILVGLRAANAAPAPVKSQDSVTVLLDFEQTHSTTSLAAMKRELQNIMDSTGMSVELRLRDEVAQNAQFNRLVLFKMKGACTMNALPIGALSDERGPLAMTYSSDGKLLSFGEIECDRVRESLQRTLGRGNPEERQATYGTALARVMAHEMYHMIANSKTHTKEGVTRESLSSWDLLDKQLPLSDRAEAAVRNGLRRSR